MPKYKVHISINPREGINADDLMDWIKRHLLFHDFEGVISPVTNVIFCFKNMEESGNHLGHIDYYLNSLEKQFDYISTIIPSPCID